MPASTYSEIQVNRTEEKKALSYDYSSHVSAISSAILTVAVGVVLVEGATVAATTAVTYISIAVITGRSLSAVGMIAGGVALLVNEIANLVELIEKGNFNESTSKAVNDIVGQLMEPLSVAMSAMAEALGLLDIYENLEPLKDLEEAISDFKGANTAVEKAYAVQNGLLAFEKLLEEYSKLLNDYYQRDLFYDTHDAELSDIYDYNDVPELDNESMVA